MRVLEFSELHFQEAISFSILRIKGGQGPAVSCKNVFVRIPSYIQFIKNH